MEARKTQGILSVLLLSSLSTFAQFMKMPDPSADIAVIKAQPLVVLLSDEDPKELRTLANKPAELAQYKAYVAQHNAQLRDLAPKLWKFSPAVEFKQEAEYKELRKVKKAHAVVLRYAEDKMGQSAPGPMGHRLETISLGSYVRRQMELDIVGDGDEHQVWAGPAPLGAAYAGDIASTLRSLQVGLERKAANAGKTVTYRQEMMGEAENFLKNTGVLRTKTLLLSQADLQDQLTEADIRKLYPNPVQVVPLQTIETAILEGDARYTYARCLAHGAGRMGPVISDAATGTAIACLDSKQGIGREQLQTLAQVVAFSGQDIKQLKNKEKMLILSSLPQ
jgi:hypothetical protein